MAGYSIWQVRSMDEAVEWAKRFPNPMPGPSDVEIRPLWEPEAFDPEIVAEVNARREKIAEGGSEISSSHATRLSGHSVWLPNRF